MPDDVQPQEGQGTEGTESPYDSYLQSVPPEAKEAAEQWFRDTSKGLDAKLQEAAQLRNTLGPYKDVDLSGYDPEDLSQLLAWHQQVTANPDTFKEWLTREAQEAGITPAEEEQLEQAEESGELTREQIQQLIQQTAEERLGPVQAQVTALEEREAVNEESQAIDKAFGEIQNENKLELTKDQRAVILDLGMPLALDEKGNELPMGDSSWVKAGFDRWREIQSAGQRLFVEEKAAQPSGSLTAGGTPQFKPATTFEEANAQMRERLRQQS